MRKVLTVFIILLCQIVVAQDPQKVEFRNIPGKIVKADDSPAPGYKIGYYGTQIGTSTDHSGNFNVNVPMDLPVMLMITDGDKLELLYNVKPYDASILIKIDEMTLASSKFLLNNWNKNKTRYEQFWTSVYNTEKFREYARKDHTKNFPEQEITIAAFSPSPSIPEGKKIFQDYECEIKPSSLTNGLKFPEFVKANLVYPQSAKEYNIQGKAFVSFVVEPDGTLSDIKIPRKLSPECDKEAIRLVKLAKWSPGSVGGKKVRTQFNQIVLFQL